MFEDSLPVDTPVKLMEELVSNFLCAVETLRMLDESAAVGFCLLLMSETDISFAS